MSPVFAWRALVVGVLGAALAVLACCLWPLTPVQGSLAAAVPTLAGLAGGGALDIRAAGQALRQAEQRAQYLARQEGIS